MYLNTCQALRGGASTPNAITYKALVTLSKRRTKLVKNYQKNQPEYNDTKALIFFGLIQVTASI